MTSRGCRVLWRGPGGAEPGRRLSGLSGAQKGLLPAPRSVILDRAPGGFIFIQLHLCLHRASCASGPRASSPTTGQSTRTWTRPAPLHFQRCLGDCVSHTSTYVWEKEPKAGWSARGRQGSSWRRWRPQVFSSVAWQRQLMQLTPNVKGPVLDTVERLG